MPNPEIVEVNGMTINTVPDQATYDAMEAQGLITENELWLVAGPTQCITYKEV